MAPHGHAHKGGYHLLVYLHILNKTKKEENISVVDSIASAIMAYELPK